MATARVGAVPVPITELWNPQTCPAGILPWLAWGLSLDEWSADWTEQQKRDAIANSVETHRRKGTIGAVRRALQAIGYEVTIKEHSDGPYTFAIYLDASQGDVSEDTFQEAERIALSSKNVRSHLSSVGAILNTDAEMPVRSVTLSGHNTDILPEWIGLLESIPIVSILSAIQDVNTTEILPISGGPTIQELTGSSRVIANPLITNTVTLQ